MQRSIINQITDCPKSYLIHYYDDLKSKVDIEFELKLQEIKDFQLKESTTKQWITLIDIIDKCLAICINNTIPFELIDQAKQKLDNKESNQVSINELERIMLKLQSYLFSNNSCLAILISKKDQIFIAEEGFDPLEVERLVL